MPNLCDPRWRFYNDPEYRAWLELTWHICQLWRRILEPVTA